MRVRGQNVNITANEYPGIPGNAGYVEAAKGKYEQVIRSLGIAIEGAALLAKIDSVAGLKDVSELLGAMVEAGSAAAKKFNSSGV